MTFGVSLARPRKGNGSLWPSVARDGPSATDFFFPLGKNLGKFRKSLKKPDLIGYNATQLARQMAREEIKAASTQSMFSMAYAA